MQARHCLGSRVMHARHGLKMAGYKPRKGGMNRPRCGARTRRGTPCLRRELFRGGRCRNHGGLSTGAKVLKPGPKTEAGKRRLWEGHQRWRAEQRRLKAEKHSNEYPMER